MLSPRLLLSFCPMFLPVLCLGQERQKTSAVPETCPVTKPATQPFVPPPPYPAKPSGGQFWFGTDRLWTALPKTGAWIGLGHYTPAIRHSDKSWLFGDKDLTHTLQRKRNSRSAAGEPILLPLRSRPTALAHPAGRRTISSL